MSKYPVTLSDFGITHYELLPYLTRTDPQGGARWWWDTSFISPATLESLQPATPEDTFVAIDEALKKREKNTLRDV